MSAEPTLPVSQPSKQTEELAQRFHETYERLAPSFGYKTREESAKPWAEVPVSNRDLMTAVCQEILAERGRELQQARAELADELSAHAEDRKALETAVGELQQARADRFSLRCPHCDRGKNSEGAGGNKKCFHCGECGFIECEWCSPVHELFESMPIPVSTGCSSESYDACIRTIAEIQKDMKELTRNLERMRTDRDYWKDRFYAHPVPEKPKS